LARGPWAQTFDVGDLLALVLIAAIAGAAGLGIGMVISKTALRRTADRALEEDEEPRDATD